MPTCPDSTSLHLFDPPQGDAVTTAVDDGRYLSTSVCEPERTLPPAPPRTRPAEDSDALLRLVLCAGSVAPRRALLERFGNAESALAAGMPAWRDMGLDAVQCQLLGASESAQHARARQWLMAPGHHLLGWSDPDYPPLLRRSPSAPLALFIAGDPAHLWRPAIAIVGSRQPTPGGRDNAGSFGRAFARAGITVSSGLAAGIDTAAHQATLQAGGVTVAVLGTGPDVPYPTGNAALLEQVACDGVVVSEHPPGTGPRKEHFPSRNRILAALTSGTVVIEAAARSGALITARLAAEAGREVFALPGSIHNPMARGCHRLIRDGATLVESPADVLDALARPFAALAGELQATLAAGLAVDSALPARVAGQMCERTGPSAAPQPRPRRSARVGAIQPNAGHGPTPDDPNSHLLWKALGHDPTDMDQLVSRTGLTAADLSSMLLLMELEGRVTAQHGRYHRSR